MKRTYQPHNTPRKRTHGFLVRMKTKNGHKVINARRAKGRKNFPSKPYDSLKNKSEFDRVYQKGFKKHNPFFRSLFWIYQKSHQKKRRL